MIYFFMFVCSVCC